MTIPESQPSESPAQRRHRVRRTVAAILAVLSGLFVGVGVTSVWVHRTTYKTSEWVATVGPLARDARIQAALATWTSGEVNQAVDTESFFKELLPPKAQPLAAPLSTAVNSFVVQAAQNFFASDAFQKIWVEANRTAHAQIVKVLKGGGDAVSTKNGKVQLNLLPVVDQVLQAVNDRTNGKFADKISSVTNLTPDQARAKLSAALGRPLPPDFGTITIFETQQLSTVQKAVQLFNDLVYVVVILALLLIGLAFAIAPDRRRIAVWVGLSGAGFLVALRATARASGKRVVAIVLPNYRDATHAVVDRVLSSYLDVTLVALLIFLLIALIAFLAGPARAAVVIREKVRDQRWIAAYAGPIQIGILVLALAYVLFANLTFGKLFLAALLAGALEVALWRLRAAAQPSPTEPAPTEPAPV